MSSRNRSSYSYVRTLAPRPDVTPTSRGGVYRLHEREKAYEKVRGGVKLGTGGLFYRDPGVAFSVGSSSYRANWARAFDCHKCGAAAGTPGHEPCAFCGRAGAAAVALSP